MPKLQRDRGSAVQNELRRHIRKFAPQPTLGRRKNVQSRNEPSHQIDFIAP